MKINKRGSQSTNSSAQHLVFHNRKNSMNEPITFNSLIHLVGQSQNERGSVMPSESQPVLKKFNDQLNEKPSSKQHSRQPSSSTNQQSLNEVKDGQYMLKIQKYKKMKNELNMQTKQILKKCLKEGDTNMKSMQKSQASILTSQSTKHCNTQQNILNKVEQSMKENSNYASNQVQMMNSINTSNSIKSSTLKFSINNLLNEISSRTNVTSCMPNFNSSINSKQNNIAAKNHTSLMQLKNQSQLASSKMMMALHKKCNSITNSSQISMVNQTQIRGKSSNTSCVEVLSQERQIDEDQNILSQKPMKIDNLKKETKKNLNQISQIEFFDENVRINEVPQSTPRNIDKRKGCIQHNERYKEIEETESSQKKCSKVPLTLLSDFSNRPIPSQTKKPSHVMISLMPNQATSNNTSIKIQTSRGKINDTENATQKKIFEMKRRSCDEFEKQEPLANNFIIEPQSNNNLVQTQRVKDLNQFAQRKYSHQVQESEFLSKPNEILKHYNKEKSIKTAREQESQKNNPKDEIINYIGKYIKQQNDSNNMSQQQLHKQIKEQEETLQNLKDFLQYLEDKNIINTKNLENNQQEMSNLIQDLMKLDLQKFGGNNRYGQTCKNSPINSQNNSCQITERRNSADKLVMIEAPASIINFKAGMCSPQGSVNRCQGQQNLPVNSPMTNSNFNSNAIGPGVVCYYTPVNVNGNNNIVNTNVQIYPANPINPKAFNCSQKLFIGNPNDNVSQDFQDVQLRAPTHNHKRVNSMNDQAQQQFKTPVVLNQKFNFGFGGGQNSQKMLMIDQHDNLNQSSKIHFHQRKNSMFIQGEPHQVLGNQLLPKDDIQEEDEEAIIQNQKAKITHRRANTNFIQPQKNIQTLQPPPLQPVEAVFNDDIGLFEERDKLIKYIKLYTKKRIEVPETTLDFYKFVKLIGKGAFGKVTLGIHKLTGKQVAIKTVDKSLMKDDYQRKKVLQEVYLLKKVRHTNVIRLFEVFESPKHLLMVMEYAGRGDLLQYVKKKRRLEEPEARKIFKQIVYGLAHCHCRSVLHRDIKLDNILIDNDGEIKICDFGVSRVIQKNQKINEQCGTPAYIAPEIISDQGYDGYTADIWSLGVLLYAMLCGTVPFKAQNMHELHQIITSGTFSFPPHVVGILSSEAKDLILSMLVIKPQDRISIPEILSHPWMTSKDEFMLENDSIDLQNGISKRDLMMSTTTEEGEINSVNVDNLFPHDSYNTKLSYTDYCAITQDFATMHLDEEALQVLEGLGLPRKLVRDGLNKGELNHATASYNLLVLS